MGGTRSGYRPLLPDLAGGVDQLAVDAVEEAAEIGVAGAQAADRLSRQGGLEDVEQQGGFAILQEQEVAAPTVADAQGRGPGSLNPSLSRCLTPPMTSPQPRRPAWLQWLILVAFLWSSWQLAGLWLQRLHG